MSASGTTTAAGSAAGSAARWRAYGAVVRAPGMTAWALAVLGQRIPVAAAPLALVYLGEARGSFALGAVMAGVFAAAEALAAGVMGRRFDRRSPGPELRCVLGVQAVLLAVMGLPALLGAPGVIPDVALVVLTALAGAVAAGAHGGLRALAVRGVTPALQPAALGLEATLTTALWVVGPALVGATAALGSAGLPTVAVAGVAAAGAVVAGRLCDPGPAPRPGVDEGAGVWRRCWPALAQEGAVMTVVGAAYTALASLLLTRGADDALTGPVLGGFALAGVLGGLVYGSRRTPGNPRRHAAVLAVLVAVLLAVAAVVPHVVAVVVGLVAAGAFATPALTARAAALQSDLRESTWASGFSGLYAAGGVGFGVAGLLVAGLLGPVGPGAAMVVCAGLAVVAVLVAAAAERRGTSA